MISNLKKRVRIISILALILLNSFLVWNLKSQEGRPVLELKAADFPELKEISGEASFDDLAGFFKKLAEEKGAVYAYDALRVAEVPTGIDMHLLGHLVGGILYKEKGIEGIKFCTEDFRNACSHTIVIGLLFDRGEEALADIARVCREAPGGYGAYTMCFHGLGHGFLAYKEYDMEGAIELCKKTGTIEYIECVGGIVMEMMAGVHDLEKWKAQVGKYFKEDDPFYPCTAPFMPQDAKVVCILYITPHLFEAAGANLSFPDPKYYKKALSFCERLEEDRGARGACFQGFGKEFVVLAKGRDIRRISEMTEDELSNVISWCRERDEEEGFKGCLKGALQSIFWGGENDPSTSIAFCNTAKEASIKDFCFDFLFGLEPYYIKDERERDAFCREVPKNYSRECIEKVLNSPTSF